MGLADREKRGAGQLVPDQPGPSHPEVGEAGKQEEQYRDEVYEPQVNT